MAAGVGLSSGEFILWPFIASQAGLIFLWGAVLGVVTQFFLNMEIERYTLATGETALTGFNRFWKHWGLVLAVMVYFANLWPGWVLSASTLASYIFGGNPRYIAVCALLVIGAALTLAPVVYVALERLIFVKVAAVGVVVALGIAFAISADTWRALPGGLVGVGQVPLELGFALAARRGRVCRRRRRPEPLSEQLDSRQGLRHGAVRAAAGQRRSPASTRRAADRFGLHLRADARQHGALAAVVAVRQRRAVRDVRARHGRDDLPDVDAGALDALRHARSAADGGVSADRGPAPAGNRRPVVWPALLGRSGSFSLFASAMGIADYTSRLAADILKSTYLRSSPVSESRLYFWLVWGLVGLGSLILLIGMDQPLVLLVISASVGGTMMCLYSCLLFVLNRRGLPDAIKVRSYRAARAHLVGRVLRPAGRR